MRDPFFVRFLFLSSTTEVLGGGDDEMHVESPVSFVFGATWSTPVPWTSDHARRYRYFFVSPGTPFFSSSFLSQGQE